MKKVLLALLVLAGLAAACSETTIPDQESYAPAPMVTEVAPEVSGFIPDKNTTVADLNAHNFKPPSHDPQICCGGASYATVTDDNTTTNIWRGAQRTKSENTGFIPGPGSCTGGKEIYQPMWTNYLNMNSWLEMGTARLCDGSRAWYGFYTQNYNPSAPTGTLQGGIWAYWMPITGTTTHQHTILRDTGNCQIYWFLIDTYAAAQTVPLGGCYGLLNVDTGIETYHNGAALWGPGATAYNYQYAINGLWWNAHWDNWYTADPQAYLYLGGFNSMCATQNAAVPAGC